MQLNSSSNAGPTLTWSHRHPSLVPARRSRTSPSAPPPYAPGLAGWRCPFMPRRSCGATRCAVVGVRERLWGQFGRSAWEVNWFCLGRTGGCWSRQALLLHNCAAVNALRRVTAAHCWSAWRICAAHSTSHAYCSAPLTTRGPRLEDAQGLLLSCSCSSRGMQLSHAAQTGCCSHWPHRALTTALSVRRQPGSAWASASRAGRRWTAPGE